MSSDPAETIHFDLNDVFKFTWRAVLPLLTLLEAKGIITQEEYADLLLSSIGAEAADNAEKLIITFATALRDQSAAAASN